MKIKNPHTISVGFVTKASIKEVPMLFQTPMVKALLAGTKTETRRDKNIKEINQNPDNFRPMYAKDGIYSFCDETKDCKVDIKCPWSKNNVLWCKETWKPAIRMAEGAMGEYPMVRYKADSSEVPVSPEDYDWFTNLTKDGKYNYQSSMFMRRKFARIFLKITEVKLERLHDITEEGAIAEGIEPWGSIQGAYFRNYSKNATTYIKHPNHESPALNSPIKSYKSLWDKINGAGSWESNPYIWVIKFTKIENYGNV